MHAYHEAEALVAAGHLRQAADICKGMLDQHPDFPYGYYLMSSLFRATGTYNNALTFSQMAIQLLPDNPAFYIQHGQILFSMGDNVAAEEAFSKAHQLQPADPIALLLLADAKAQLGQFDEAIQLFAKAREANDIPEIDLHEGLCQFMKGNLDKAEALFNTVIGRAPNYEWGHVQKGKLLIERKRYAEAEASFARALKCNPNAYEALHGIAQVCEQQSQYESATRYAMQAIQANPNAWQSHMVLGGLLILQRQHAMAEQILRQAHGLQPLNVYINQMLILTLIQQHKRADAVALLEQILAVKPDEQTLHYFKAMLTGEAVPVPPSSYISNLFDHYADRFDHHLVHVLGYRMPSLMAQLVAELRPDAKMTMLDLGCGTGLAAEAFQSITSQRVGVDLSARMVAKARDRKLYNALYAQDIVEFMQQCEQPFDLVVAADVFVYVGDLTGIFRAARRVLERNGLLVFSIERGDHLSDYQLQPTGRYTHSPMCVERLAAEQGYSIEHRELSVVRMENDAPVDGVVYILKKHQTH